ncbi:MAG: TRAP transporter substrate-binding protein [Betaproteobacteria bacterium]|nr:TRAP transporter substrate-binding protein [Betaproteobacteria bacterium]MBA3777100.1 TRAP transporter substrate-binding protein [Betaproteobacteria bacterium]
MKRIGFTFALAFVACAAQAQLPPGPKVTITMATQPGPGLPQFSKVDVPMLREDVPKKSGGRVEIKLASWPEMSLNGPEVIRLVRSGQVDIGAAPLATVSGDVPFLDAVDLAGLNPTIDVARKVAAAIVPLANKELERTGTRIIAVYPFPAQVFFCKTPVKSLADLKGKKVRTHGGSLNDLMSAIGAQPVAIGFPEVYSALDKGVADCAITGTSSGNGAKWYEVTNSLYTLPVGWAIAGYFVNINWLSKLDPAVREFLLATMRQVEEAQWALGREATSDGIACNSGNASSCKIGTLVSAKPMSVSQPTDADRETVRKLLSEKVLPAWVQRCGARCGDVFNEHIAPIAGVKYEK